MAGADAVYGGGLKFGARAYARNFTSEELICAIDHAHLLDRRFYLTVNTAAKNVEIPELYEHILPLYEAGLDAVIVQDAGVIALIKECFPDMPVHASTQMAITGKEGVLLLKDMGISRVVPARELILDELKMIHESTGMELECFIHGALCYSYSGKCLFSSLAGGRSGNRGRCAQPCRLPYDGSYILSARDIMTIEILPELIKAGISSFKIEGRMKPKEYVAAVTGIYRKYIDMFLAGEKEYKTDKADIELLDSLYTRSGHCTGYYHEKNGKDMITVGRPSYDTQDKQLYEKLYDVYTGDEKRICISGRVTAHKGEPLCVYVSDGRSKITEYGSMVEGAKTHPLSEDDIRKQLIKTGDTVFGFEDLYIDADDDIFIPVSELNKVRRQALLSLKKEILAAYKRNNAKLLESDDMHTDVEISCRQYINCHIDDLSLLDGVLKYSFIDSVTVNAVSLSDKRKVESISDRIHKSGKKMILSLPAIIRDQYFDRNPLVCSLINNNTVDGILADNYESLYFVGKSEFNGLLISDLHLYVLNDQAARMLNSLGADIITYSPEANKKELANLNAGRGEFILYGRLPMMISAQCTQKTTGACLKDNGISYIKDRLGNEFPCVRTCSECHNTILNCVPQMIIPDDLPRSFKPFSYRLHFTVERGDEAFKVLDFYEAVFDGLRPERPDIKHTLGHLKRGVE